MPQVPEAEAEAAVSDRERELHGPVVYECGECGEAYEPDGTLNKCTCPQPCSVCGGLLYVGEEHECDLSAPWMANAKFADDGTRLTDCCGAYSTHVEYELVCKGCYNVVPQGQGDGTQIQGVE